MLNSPPRSRFSRETILKEVINIIEAQFPELEMGFSGGIRPKSRLITDLGFESINLVQFAGAVEKHFKIKNLPFWELFMGAGVFIEELKIVDAVEFLHTHLNNQ